MLKYIKSKLNKINLKKVLFVWAFSVLWFGLFFNNVTYAQTDDTQTVKTATLQDDLIDTNQIFDSILKLLYALLWPVLFIIGLALDNTLVYWSFLHLDASLWSLWNIMKNFANFALWFFVLFAIVRNIFTAPFGGSGDKRSPQKIITKTLIAWVLIQMSWFLMAAVIDISTILTYSIGWLPMTLMQKNADYKDVPILAINADLNLDGQDDKKMNLDYYHTYGDKNLSLCRVERIDQLSGSYIVGRQKVVVESGVFFESWYCAMWAWPYKYNEYWTWYVDNENYKLYVDWALKDWEDWTELKNNCNIISLDASQIPDNCQDYGFVGTGDDIFASASMTLDTILEKSKGFVWPFITIYSSILNFTDMVSAPVSDNVLVNFFHFLIKVWFGIALFFPLIALAAVLIARIWILWLAIAILPIIILLKVFEWVIDIWKGDGWLMQHFQIDQLIKLIFAPVFVVFAISMSMIFLSSLSPKNALPWDSKWAKWLEVMEEAGITKSPGWKTYSVFGLVDINLSEDELWYFSDGMDNFAWIMTNLFAVAIIWFFLFFAVKMTKIWESIGWWFQGAVQKFMSNIPILPIWWWVWIAAASEWLKWLWDRISKPMYDAQMKELQKQLPFLYWTADTTADEATSWNSKLWDITNYTTREKVVNSFAINDWDANKVWNSLSANDKSVLATAWITTADQLWESYTYLTNNYTSFVNTKWKEEESITTYDAEKFTSETINNMVKRSWSSWQDWAKWVLWWNVQTQDGIYVMVNQWTHADPDFQLVSQEEYEKDYLWITDDWLMDQETIENNIRTKISKKYWEESELSEQDKKDMEDHIQKEIKELQDRMNQINSRDNKSNQNNSQETESLSDNQTESSDSEDSQQEDNSETDDS